jgi:hypothetical protein
LPGYCCFFSVDLGNLEAVIKSIAREHHWTPEQIDNLYLDSQDHYGAEYWYEDIQAMHKELETKTPKVKK